FPGVEERDVGVIDAFSLFIPRVLVVASAEGVWRVDEVAVKVVDLQPPEAGVEGGLDPLGAVVGVPEFGGDKEVFARNDAGLERGMNGVADGFFVAVTLGAIEVAEADFDGGAGGLFGG